MANVMGLVNAIRDRHAAKQSDNDAAYWALVHQCAKTDVDPDEVVAELAALGRDVEQFQQHLELVTERHQLAALNVKLPDLLAQKAAADEKWSVIVEEFQKIEEAHAAKGRDFRDARAAIDTEIAESVRAGELLRRSCPYQHIADQLAEIRTAKAEALKLVSYWNDVVREHERWLTKPVPGKTDQEYTNVINHHEAANQLLPDRRAKLAEFQRRQRELEQQEEALESQRLNP